MCQKFLEDTSDRVHVGRKYDNLVDALDLSAGGMEPKIGAELVRRRG